MIELEELQVLPFEFQRDWQAELLKNLPTPAGVFRLVGIERTPRAFEQQRVTVVVVDENGLPLNGIAVAFSYSTADRFYLTEDFKWHPPSPHRAEIIPTRLGVCDQVQGDMVKAGEPGGVTVYVFEPEYSNDVVSGCGMLNDHTGLRLTFQLRRVGVESWAERLDRIESTLGRLIVQGGK